MGEPTLAPSAGELITTSVVDVGVEAGDGGGSLVDAPPLELPPLVVPPALAVLPLEPLPLVLLPGLELLPELVVVPGAEDVPPVPALGLVVSGKPEEDTFVFVELSRDFVYVPDPPHPTINAAKKMLRRSAPCRIEPPTAGSWVAVPKGENYGRIYSLYIRKTT